MKAELEPVAFRNDHLNRAIVEFNDHPPYEVIVSALFGLEREGLFDYEAQQRGFQNRGAEQQERRRSDLKKAAGLTFRTLHHIEFLQDVEIERLENEGRSQYEDEQMRSLDKDFYEPNAVVNGHDGEEELPCWPKVTRQSFILRPGTNKFTRRPHKHNSNEEAVADAKENSRFFLKRVMDQWWGRSIEKKIPIRTIYNLRAPQITLEDFDPQDEVTPQADPNGYPLRERNAMQEAANLTFRAWELYEQGDMF